jgi:hypothetical protein
MREPTGRARFFVDFFFFAAFFLPVFRFFIAMNGLLLGGSPIHYYTRTITRGLKADA